MPNHVHFVYDRPKIEMWLIVNRIKSYTSKKILEIPGIPFRKTIWLRGYFDRGARSDRHLSRMMAYTLFNPVLSKLVSDPFDWPHSSISKYLDRKEEIRAWWAEYEAERLYNH